MAEVKMNSQTESERIEPKKVEPVVSKPATTKKKSVFGRFVDDFIAEDAKDVGDYIVQDVLIPKTRGFFSTIMVEAAKTAADIIFGETRPSSSNVPATRVAYRNVYDNSRNNSYSQQRQRIHQSQSYMDGNYILYENRGDAEAVLMALQDAINEYGVVSVADYYDLSGVQTKFTDFNIGWSDLRYAEVVRMSNGYSIKLPKPMPID